MSERSSTTVPAQAGPVDPQPAEAVPGEAASVRAGSVEFRRAWREQGRALALKNALAKREAGVPSYSIPEAAALLSVSQEHLYRLVRADAFPAVRMRTGSGEQGRYVIPAKAVERLLDATADAGLCVEAAEFTDTWRTTATPAMPAMPAGARTAAKAATGWGGGAA